MGHYFLDTQTLFVINSCSELPYKMGNYFLDKQFKIKIMYILFSLHFFRQYKLQPAANNSWQFLGSFSEVRATLSLRLPDGSIHRQNSIIMRGMDFSHLVVNTVCPGSSVPFYIVTYCIKWVTTSWTHSKPCKHWNSPDNPAHQGSGDGEGK